MKTKCYIGESFNNLTVVASFLKKQKEGCRRTMFLCECECGVIKNICGRYVVNGIVKSCGCLHRKHGMRGTRFYNIWAKMKDRCLRKTAKDFKNYGGRGVFVCNDWINFKRFRDDMYESYLSHVNLHGEKDTTIDRIDNDGDYKLSNCRWATQKQQHRNTSYNRMLKFKGEILTLAGWAEKMGMRRDTLRYRIDKLGWTIEKAITNPVRKLTFKNSNGQKNN